MPWRLSSALIPFATILNRVLSPAVIIVTRPTVNLSYKILGDEQDFDYEVPPLLLVHGLLESKRQWESLGKTLQTMTRRPVVVLDQRNHGDSPHHGSQRYEEMAGDVARLLDKLAVERACLVGYSLGGRTCMCVSLLHPAKVAALLVVDVSPASSPPYLTDYLPKVLEAMSAVKFDRPKTVRKAKKQAKKQLKTVINDDNLMKTVLSNINIKADGTIGWTCNLNALINNFKNIASFPNEIMKGKKYRGPTLFIGGQLSDFIPPDDLTNIRGYFPHAVVHYVPKTGHDVHEEHPEAFLEFVIAFFRGVK